MAIYRSDQAQVTFAVEAAPGGSPELASAVTLATSGDAGECAIDLTAGQPAGSRSLTVDGMAASEFVKGDIIVIGTTATESSEIRRVEFVDGTTGLVLDAPTGFFHANNTVIKIITAVTDTAADKYITFVPGVYETVEVPDPQMAIEPKYYLGTASKRNPYQFLKGQQTFTGSIGGFVLLDGRALRFPIGKVNTTTTFVNTGGTTDPDYGALINNAAGYKKGDVFVTVDTAWTSVPVGTHLLFTGSTTPATTSSATCEIRKHVGAASATALRLNAPLQFDHVNNEYVYAITTTAGGTTVQSDATMPTTLIPFTHTIAETVDLDSVSWHVHVRDSSEDSGLTAPVTNDFDRRYHGGKIGNLSLSAEEGGLLTCGWDGVNFLGMNHNQKTHSGFTGDLPSYTLMQPIRDGDVSAPGTISSSGTTAEPYYFSQGQVTLFGSVIARVRSFSLSINNNEEPRYYLRRTMGNHRGTSEILEQRREYTCSVTLALPDATTNTSSAISVFKELLLEGDYASGMQGFNIELRFDRGANDSIVLTIPSDGAAAPGGNQQGAFINTAPHNISEANPMEVEAEILFRNLSVVVNDNIPCYP
jgi:hypothetical protein